MNKIIFTVLTLILITGCRNSYRNPAESVDLAEQKAISVIEPSLESSTSEINNAVERKQSGQPQSPTSEPVITKKIIRDGNMTLKVKDLTTVRKQVDSMVSALGGYIGNESFNSYEQESQYFLIIRIPALHFDELVARLEKGTGEVLNKVINAHDVTEEFIDLDTRLANKRKFIDRYTQLLKKAGSVKDILEIEENIRKIEEEIESAEGRLRYLNSQVNYSTLNLTLTQEKDYQYKPQQSRNFIERLKESLHKGWKGFVGFILLMIRIWPFWILATGAWILYRKIKRRKKVTTGFRKN